MNSIDIGCLEYFFTMDTGIKMKIRNKYSIKMINNNCSISFDSSIVIVSGIFVVSMNNEPLKEKKKKKKKKGLIIRKKSE
jgi:hypothetical protein